MVDGVSCWTAEAFISCGMVMTSGDTMRTALRTDQHTQPSCFLLAVFFSRVQFLLDLGRQTCKRIKWFSALLFCKHSLLAV